MNWYGFIIALGIVICVVIAYFTAKHRGIEGDVVIDVVILGLPFVILGLRTYYVIFDTIAGGHWTFKKFIGLEDGGLEGLAIYGGLIGVLVAAVVYVMWKRRKKNPINKRISYMQLLDLVFTFMILGQAIGRWGNFANEEAYGYLITNPSLKWFPMGVEINGDWYYATFFYESMWNIVGFALLYFLYMGKRKSFDGFVFSCYCIYYGIGRSWIEGMRSDSLWLVPPSVAGVGGQPDVGGVRVSQLVSIIMILFGVAYIIAHIIRAKKAGKKIFIFVKQDKLNADYFGYEKTKLAVPMPDIKFWKDRNKKSGDGIIVDNNGVAIKIDEEVNDDGTEKGRVASDGGGTSSSVKAAQQAAEENYEDRWDD